MTAAYRVKFCNALTDGALDEFDLDSVTCETRIGAAGTLSATIPLAREDYSRGARIAAIKGSGATAIYVYRNGSMWWDGLLWTPTRACDTDGKPKVTISGGTFESYLDRVQLGADLAPLTSTDQLAIFKSFIDDMQSDPYANMRLVCDTATSGVPRDRVQYLKAARPTYLKMGSELAGLDNGFEFLCQASTDSTGARTRRVRLGYPTITSATVHRISKPGAILSYSLPEDGSRAATYLMATGSGVQSTVHTDAAALALGYPRLDKTTSYSSITDATVLEAHATADLALSKTPVVVATITVRLDATDITPQCIGDQVKYAIKDENFPNGITGTARLVGMTTSLPQRGKQETCALILN